MIKSEIKLPSIGFIGFGEAGQAMSSSIIELLKKFNSNPIIYFDIKLNNQTFIQRFRTLGYDCVSTPEELTQKADVIFSTVTADQSYIAAKSVSSFLARNHIYFDCNSVSPGTKKINSKIIMQSKAKYFDLAIMEPILDNKHKSKILISGNPEEKVLQFLNILEFNFKWVGKTVGDASTIKMLQSILIKGTQSLICECVTAAEKLGIDKKILNSAGNTLGIKDLPVLADYLMERSIVHGERQSSEMNEVAKTLSELGVSNFMSIACSKHLKMISSLHLKDTFDGPVPENRKLLAKMIRAKQANLKN